MFRSFLAAALLIAAAPVHAQYQPPATSLMAMSMCNRFIAGQPYREALSAAIGEYHYLLPQGVSPDVVGRQVASLVIRTCPDAALDAYHKAQGQYQY